MAEMVYGRWAVMETMRARRREIQQLVLAEGVEDKGIITDMMAEAQSRGVPIKHINRRMMDDLARDANHQGAMLRVGPYPYTEIDRVMALAAERGEKPFLLLIDLLQDPQNVGALLRVADVVGVNGVILQDRRSVGITDAVTNASAGAAGPHNVMQALNLVNTMKELKEKSVTMA